MTALAKAWDSPVRRWIVAAVALAGAAWLITRVLKGFSWPLFLAALRATPPWAIGAAVALTPVSYACLAVTEWFVLHSLGQPLHWRRAGRVAFAAYAVSNSLGFSYATGAAVRLKLYGGFGLPAAAAARVMLVAGTAVTLAGVVTAGLGLLVQPATFAAAFHARAWMVTISGAVLITPGLLWFAALRGRDPARRVAAQGLGPRALALAAAIGDWATSGAALYILLPKASLAGFGPFITVYVLGSLVSAATGVPGGVGVFEAVVLGLSTLMARADETATALILYRVIYSLGPLAVMGAALSLIGLMKRGRASA